MPRTHLPLRTAPRPSSEKEQEKDKNCKTNLLSPDDTHHRARFIALHPTHAQSQRTSLDSLALDPPGSCSIPPLQVHYPLVSADSAHHRACVVSSGGEKGRT
jgi:hypothetical protein